ncbi:transposase, partial [Vibrio parahaemolyticus]
ESITKDDFLFASQLTSGNKPTFWKNPFIEGVKVTKEMLRSPPRSIGWEDYYQQNNSRKKKGKGRPDFFDK